jgi:proline dehydrogenase
VLRHLLLYLSRQAWARDLLMRTALTRTLPWRFVAGETLEAALAVARRLAADGLLAILDPLGENVASEAEAVAAADHAIQALRGIAAAGQPAHLSIKLTQLGLDVGTDLCRRELRRVLACAAERDVFVCIDMEGSAYTQRTLDLFAEAQQEHGPDRVGTVIQSYLYRSRADLEKLIERRARLRLVKGAYDEPAAVAYASKADVDRAYREQMELLLRRGRFPAIATHDEALLAHGQRYARQAGIPAAGFEFQMLLGVRRDLQLRLRRQGYNVRIYVPYGQQWYPYLMRRLAERPANIAFVLRSTLRERAARRRGAD